MQVPARVKTGAVLFAAALGLGACADDSALRRPTASKSASAISALERMRFGCELIRGTEGDEAAVRYYSIRASHSLFIAALEAQPGDATAARLWNVTDGLMRADSRRNQAQVLNLCDGAGAGNRAGIPELRNFACEVNEELTDERPDIKSFGVRQTKAAPGDPLRSDAEFQGYAYMVLNFGEGPGWLDGPAPALGLLGNDDHEYRAGLRHFSKMCSTRAPSAKPASRSSAG